MRPTSREVKAGAHRVIVPEKENRQWDELEVSKRLVIRNFKYELIDKN